MNNTNLFTSATFTVTLNGKETQFPSAVSQLLTYEESILRGRESGLIVGGDWAGEATLDVQELAKRAQTGRILVGIHSGEPHADDLGCVTVLDFVLHTVLFGIEFKVEVVRSRSMSELADCDLVLDVMEGILDHHGARADRDHGVSALTRLVRLLWNTDEIRETFPSRFWQNLAYWANRIGLQDVGILLFEEVAYVNHFARLIAVTEDEACWETAFDLLKKDFVAQASVWCEEAHARERIAEIITANPNANVLVFGEGTRAADPKEAIWVSKHPALYFVSRQGENDWRVLCTAIPKEGADDAYQPFSSRFLLPESWRGLRAEALEEASKIKDAIFVHKDGWIGAWKSEEAAVMAANRAVELLSK